MNILDITKHRCDLRSIVQYRKLDQQNKLDELRYSKYCDTVVQLIRQKYSVDDEFAILRQQLNKPEEFAEYNEYCETCKVEAKNAIYGDNQND
jgi:hypothetical protein